MPTHSDSGYEKRDVNVLKLGLIALVCVILLASAAGWVWTYFVRVSEETMYKTQLQPGSLTLDQLRAHEDSVLYRYGIVDTAAGTYQIPIDSAMKLLAAEAGKSVPSSR